MKPVPLIEYPANQKLEFANLFEPNLSQSTMFYRRSNSVSTTNFKIKRPTDSIADTANTSNKKASIGIQSN